MPSISGKEVGSTGFGLMGFTWRENQIPDEQAFKAMKAALSKGCNFWNGGEFYGPRGANSLTLLKRYYEAYPEDASKVVFSLKGCAGPTGPDLSPENVKECIETSLKELGPHGKIDVYECARSTDFKNPLENALATIQTYVDAGKIGGIGLSECSAATIRKAAKVAKIVSVEVELSLWATEILDNGVVEACAELNIPIVAYSPIGRGVLSGAIKSPADIPAGDARAHMARFQPGVFELNLKLVDALNNVAKGKGCTAAQLAIGWVKHLSGKGGNPVIVPIPGATTAERVTENATDVSLSEAELAEIDSILAKFPVQGERYGGFIEKYNFA